MVLISIVDDSKLVRKFIATSLAGKGFDTQEIKPDSLFGVLDQIKTHKPDLLITDLAMPGCPGQGLVKAIRQDEELKDLPILVVTAHHDSALKVRIEHLEIQGWIFKPVHPKELVAMVKDALLVP